MNSNRFFLVTSAFQLIYCSLILKKRKKKFNHYVVIFHPLNNNYTFKTIEYISKKLKINKIIDLRKDFKNFFKIKKIKISEKFSLNQLKKEKKIKERFIKTIKNRLPKSKYSEFYIRNNYANYEQIFIDIFYKNNFYGFIDGSGDFHNKLTKVLDYKLYKIRLLKLRETFIRIIKCLIIKNSFFLEKQPHSFIRQKLPTKKDYRHIKKILSKININKKINQIKLIIFNIPAIEYNHLNINIKKEIKIYNDIILQLKSKYKLKTKNIWLKCHPRIQVKNYKILKKNINCNFFSLHDKQNGELKLLNKHVKFVVAPGSSTLIYAKEVFYKKCLFLDLRNQDIDRSAFKRNYLNFKKFEIEYIQPSKKY